jgi:hypothetical protein
MFKHIRNLSLFVIGLLLISVVFLLRGQNTQAAEFTIPENETYDPNQHYGFVIGNEDSETNPQKIENNGVFMELKKVNITDSQVGGIVCYSFPGVEQSGQPNPEGWVIEHLNLVQEKPLSMNTGTSLESWIYDQSGEIKMGRCDYFFSTYAEEFDPDQPFLIEIKNMYYGNRTDCDEINAHLLENNTGIAVGCEWITTEGSGYYQDLKILEKPVSMNEEEAQIKVASMLSIVFEGTWEFEIPR